MLYQPLLSENRSYAVNIIDLCYPRHVHHEIEMIYCLEGAYNTEVNGISYSVAQEELLLVQSAVPHMYTPQPSARVLLIEIGPSFLNDIFPSVSNVCAEHPVISLKQNDCLGANRQLLRQLLCEIADLHSHPSVGSVLDTMGDLYKLCGCLLKEETDTVGTPHSLSYLNNAFEWIYTSYMNPLTVSFVAKQAGYGKSYFCKAFKQQTGMSFHAYLNEYRIKKAKPLLMNTDDSVEAIGTQVGFSQAKAFCRVFKQVEGITPGQYRRAHIPSQERSQS